MKPVLVRRHQLQDVVGVHPRTADRWVRAGAFPAPRKLNEHTSAWLMSDLEKWAAERPVSDLKSPKG
jgi:prophage regulatory protein